MLLKSDIAAFGGIAMLHWAVRPDLTNRNRKRLEKWIISRSFSLKARAFQCSIRIWDSGNPREISDGGKAEWTEGLKTQKRREVVMRHRMEQISREETKRQFEHRWSCWSWKGVGLLFSDGVEGGESVCGNRGGSACQMVSVAGRWEVASGVWSWGKVEKAWNQLSVNVLKRGLEMTADCWADRQESQLWVCVLTFRSGDVDLCSPDPQTRTALLCADARHGVGWSIWVESHTIADRENGMPATFEGFWAPGGHMWKQPAPVCEVPETFCTPPPGKLSLHSFSFLWSLNHSKCQSNSLPSMPDFYYLSLLNY